MASNVFKKLNDGLQNQLHPVLKELAKRYNKVKRIFEIKARPPDRDNWSYCTNSMKAISSIMHWSARPAPIQARLQKEMFKAWVVIQKEKYDRIETQRASIRSALMIRSKALGTDGISARAKLLRLDREKETRKRWRAAARRTEDGTITMGQKTEIAKQVALDVKAPTTCPKCHVDYMSASALGPHMSICLNATVISKCRQCGGLAGLAPDALLKHERACQSANKLGLFGTCFICQDSGIVGPKDFLWDTTKEKLTHLISFHANESVTRREMVKLHVCGCQRILTGEYIMAEHYQHCRTKKNPQLLFYCDECRRAPPSRKKYAFDSQQKLTKHKQQKKCHVLAATAANSDIERPSKKSKP